MLGSINKFCRLLRKEDKTEFTMTVPKEGAYSVGAQKIGSLLVSIGRAVGRDAPTTLCSNEQYGTRMPTPSRQRKSLEQIKEIVHFDSCPTRYNSALR